MLVTFEGIVTTVQITLPDQLAQEAERAGLLAPETVERWLRKQLKAHRAAELLADLDRLDAADPLKSLTPEAVAEEIALMRDERKRQER
jgi:hypothetical protein